MASFKLGFACDNAAFEDRRAEIVRILHEIANKIEDGTSDGYVRDINGNHVGSWEIKS